MDFADSKRQRGAIRLIIQGPLLRLALRMRIRRHSPFLIVFAIECAFISYLIVTHRGVIGHDAFQYFGLQYYFLSNAATSGEIAQWMPLMTHGTVSNWGFGVQAGTVQTAMLALGRFNRALLGLNFFSP